MKIHFAVLCSLLAAGCQSKHSPEPPKNPPASTGKPSGGSAIPAPGSFIGLTLEAAEAKAEMSDLPHRVVRKDGENFPVTRDYRPERLNFVVEKGIVTEVSNG